MPVRLATEQTRPSASGRDDFASVKLQRGVAVARHLAARPGDLKFSCTGEVLWIGSVSHFRPRRTSTATDAPTSPTPSTAKSPQRPAGYELDTARPAAHRSDPDVARPRPLNVGRVNDSRPLPPEHDRRGLPRGGRGTGDPPRRRPPRCPAQQPQRPPTVPAYRWTTSSHSNRAAAANPRLRCATPLARALRLSEDERAHRSHLAGHRPATWWRGWPASGWTCCECWAPRSSPREPTRKPVTVTGNPDWTRRARDGRFHKMTRSEVGCGPAQETSESSSRSRSAESEPGSAPRKITR